jgi:hypothetical protein
MYAARFLAPVRFREWVTPERQTPIHCAVPVQLVWFDHPLVAFATAGSKVGHLDRPTICYRTENPFATSLTQQGLTGK